MLVILFYIVYIYIYTCILFYKYINKLLKIELLNNNTTNINITIFVILIP